MDIAPTLVATIDTRTRNKRTVQEALTGESWMQDIRGDISFTAHIQLIHLRQAIATVHRNELEMDELRWPCSRDGEYSAKSTYEWLCQGLVRSPTAACTWRSWATLKCKIFTWLANPKEALDFGSQSQAWPTGVPFGMLHMLARGRQCGAHTHAMCLRMRGVVPVF